MRAFSTAPGGLTVRDVMQASVLSVVPEMTVRELAQTFLEKRISGAPVLDPTGRLIGVVSTTDVMQLVAREAEIPAGQVDWAPAILAEEADSEGAGETLVAFTVPGADALAETGLDQYSVRDIMTPVAFSVHPADSLSEVIQLFVRGRIHRALVMEDKVLLGIVTPCDVLQVLDGAPLPGRAVPMG